MTPFHVNDQQAKHYRKGNIFLAGMPRISTRPLLAKVSWMVTGIRQDAWANAHRFPNEKDKIEQEKGYCIHPELYGHAGEVGIILRTPHMSR